MSVLERIENPMRGLISYVLVASGLSQEKARDIATSTHTTFPAYARFVVMDDRQGRAMHGRSFRERVA